MKYNPHNYKDDSKLMSWFRKKFFNEASRYPWPWTTWPWVGSPRFKKLSMEETEKLAKEIREQRRQR